MSFVFTSKFYRAELQVARTMDFATDSWFWTVFTGKLKSSFSTIVLRDQYKKYGVPLFHTSAIRLTMYLT